MKRILVVLLFVAIASLGFSVSGQIYTKMLAGGVDGNDLSVPNMFLGDTEGSICPDLDINKNGRMGTGVDINFDTWTFTYKLREQLASTNSDYGLDKLCVPGTSLLAGSPGWFGFNSIKVGESATVGIDIAWWTCNQSANALTTNALGATNIYSNTSISYNDIDLDLHYSVAFGDVKLGDDGGISLNWYSGDAAYGQMPGTTGVNNWVSGYGIFLPVNVSFTSGGFSFNILVLYLGDGQTYSSNNLNGGIGDNQLGAVLMLGYTINDLWGVYLAGGIAYLSGGYNNAVLNSATTNTSTYSGCDVPIDFGVSLTPAPVLSFHIGYGWQIPVGLTQQYITTVAKTATTNTVTYGTIPYNEYEWQNIQPYYNPFVNLAVDTKFAEDWTAGLRFVVLLTLGGPFAEGYNGSYSMQWNLANTTGSIYNYANTSGYNTAVSFLNFNNYGDWDFGGGSTAYIGYSKDSFSVKLRTALGGLNPMVGTSQASISEGLLGLFGSVEVAIKF